VAAIWGSCCLGVASNRVSKTTSLTGEPLISDALKPRSSRHLVFSARTLDADIYVAGLGLNTCNGKEFKSGGGIVGEARDACDMLAGENSRWSNASIALSNPGLLWFACIRDFISKSSFIFAAAAAYQYRGTIHPWCCHDH
jgi:hypothetical protein